MLLINIPSISHMKALLVKSAHLQIWEDTASYLTMCQNSYLWEEIITFNKNQLIFQHNFY